MFGYPLSDFTSPDKQISSISTEIGTHENKAIHSSVEEKKKEIWLSSIQKPLYQQKIRKPMDNTKSHQNLRLHNECGPT